MPFVNLGLPGLIRDWLVRVSVVDFFVGPAVGTKSAFKFFQEPKEQAFLLSPRVAANRAVETCSAFLLSFSVIILSGEVFLLVSAELLEPFRINLR